MSYTSLGSVSLAQQAAAVMPNCYSREFDYCIDDDHRYKPECVQYEPLHQLFEEDNDAWHSLMDPFPFCADPQDSQDKLITYAVLSGLGAFAVGYFLGRTSS